eukprot:1973443-Prorocentrum_lima.AAC.1
MAPVSRRLWLTGTPALGAAHHGLWAVRPWDLPQDCGAWPPWAPAGGCSRCGAWPPWAPAGGCSRPL